MNKKMWNEQLGKSLKISIAAILAIGIASILGLDYAPTAGIVTILSIQNTKRETLTTARNRALAFLCAIVIAILCFSILGFGLLAFGVYLLIFSLVCIRASWLEAIAMDSVLITHLLTEESYGWNVLYNEVLLFAIGTCLGILVNLHLKRQTRTFEYLAEEVDTCMKNAMRRIGRLLLEEEQVTVITKKEFFNSLDDAIEEAKKCAITNLNNSILNQNIYELSYIEMRERQGNILREIYGNYKRITYMPQQAHHIGGLIHAVADNYHKENTVEGLLEELQVFYEEMKLQPLPATREEFEARALLFYILIELKKLLELKRAFIMENLQ